MTLQDTIALMYSDDYKERFEAQYCYTKNNRDALAALLQRYDAGELPPPACGIGLLQEQLVYMDGYLRCLRTRAETDKIDL